MTSGNCYYYYSYYFLEKRGAKGDRTGHQKTTPFEVQVMQRRANNKQFKQFDMREYGEKIFLSSNIFFHLDCLCNNFFSPFACE